LSISLVNGPDHHKKYLKSYSVYRVILNYTENIPNTWPSPVHLRGIRRPRWSSRSLPKLSLGMLEEPRKQKEVNVGLAFPFCLMWLLILLCKRSSHGSVIIRHFTVVINIAVLLTNVLITGNHLRTDLIIVSKARSLQLQCNSIRSFTKIGSKLACKYSACVKMAGSDQCASLQYC